jgi:hypothetical protein
MNPVKDDHVVVAFRNGTSTEGIVQSWSDSKSVLLSKKDNSNIIILHTSEDVMLIKIITKVDLKKEIITKNIIENKIEETIEELSSEKRLEKLIELRTELIEQDKKIITQKLKEHVPSERSYNVSYGNITTLPKI